MGYLDPGFGSMLVQALLASIAAVAVMLGIYREKIKALFRGNKNKPSGDETGESGEETGESGEETGENNEENTGENSDDE